MLVRFQVLMAASMKLIVFWGVSPFSVVKFTDVSEVRGGFIFTAITPETKFNFFYTTRRNNT
jgi:hypothetical protein